MSTNLSVGDLKELQKKYTDQKYADRTNKVLFRKESQQSELSLIGNFIDYLPLKKAISLYPFTLKQKKVLDICCGNGFEAEFLVKMGAQVTVSDISEEAIKAAKRRCKWAIKGAVADAEKLPFKSGSFDLTIAHAGLHHLPNPHRGISEMARVSRTGFIFVEAQKNCITQILIKLGFAEEYEESGNYVYRFSRKEIHKVMKKIQIKDYKIVAMWCRYCEVLNKNVYPSFNNRYWFIFFKFIFLTFNKLFGYWGNTLIVVGLKDQSSRRRKS